MTIRKYSSRSQQTTLTSSINATATTMNVTSASNLMASVTPTGGETFTVVIDPDTAVEEIVDVTGVSGSVLTIERGVDNAGSGSLHSAGAIVRHMVIGRDLNEANQHIENITLAHGLTIANVVTTAGTQTLTNKTLTSPTITGTGAIAGTFTGNLTGNVTGNVSGTAGSATGNAATATALVTGRTFQLTGDIEASAVSFNGTGNVSLTTVIGTGAIVNADVNASAAIDKTKISGTAITAADSGTVTSAMIANDTIVNADINTSAQIAYGKLNLTNTVVNADINASAAIDKTKISGTAITAGDTGTVTSTMIADGTILNVDINAAAAIDWTKLGISSTVSSTEIGYVDGVTSAIQTQIDSKLATATAASTYAPLVSPALTGVPTAPTAAANTNTTQVATTAYVQTEIADLIAAAPGALDTLDELAAALGDDANFATTVTNSLATKLPLAGGTMTGAIAMGTSKITGLGTPTVSTDASTKAYVDTMLPLAGGTMSGAIAMGTSKITGLGDPTNLQDAVTINYLNSTVLAPSNLTGPITSIGAATSLASQTGTGTKFVVDNSPTLITPVLGVATATSINGTTIPSSKTLVATDSTDYVVPSQTGNTGKYLTTNGTVSSWQTALPTISASTTTTNVFNNNSFSITVDNSVLSAGQLILFSYSNALTLADVALFNASFPVGTPLRLADQSAPTTTFTSGTVSGAAYRGGGPAGSNSAIYVNISDITGTGDYYPSFYVQQVTFLTTGKYLTNNGTTSSWGTVATYSAPTLGSTSIASGATVTTIAGLTLTAPTLTGTVTASGDINLSAAGGPGSVIDELTLILMGAL